MLEQHLEKLRGFHATARSQSIQAGARMLGISQPSLTKSIQVLEGAINNQLFVRHRRGVELTPAGEVLFSYCERLLSELPDIQKRIESPSENAGQIRVGSYETIGLTFWPRALLALRKSHPQLSVHISTQGAEKVWEKLQVGIIDLIVDAEPLTGEQYFSKVLYVDRFGLFAKPGAQFPEKIPFSYVQRAADRNGVLIETHLRERKINSELIYDFDTFVSVQAIVHTGLAVGVLPITFAKEYVRRKELTPFKIHGSEQHFGEHRICVTCLESRRKDPRIKAVSQVMRDSIR